MCVPREQRPLLLLEHSRTIEDALDATERERDEARAALAKAEEDRGQWMRRHVACELANKALQAELAELRDGFRLCLWMSLGMPWDEVPDREVTAYVEKAKQLKAGKGERCEDML